MLLQSTLFRRNDRLAAAAANNPPLKKGDTGDAVARLQQALISIGHPLPVSTAKRGRPDGIYGSETKAKVAAFQSGRKPALVDDGIAGANTLSSLDALLVGRHVPFPGDEDIEIAHVFRIAGTPAPQGLPPWVTWSPAGYRAAVLHQLKTNLLASRVGRAVLGLMKGSITIRPSPHAREARAFYKPSERTLYYTPGSYIAGSKLYASSKHFVGFTPDAALMHELVHAMRQGQGFSRHDDEVITKIHYPPWAPADNNPLHYLFFGNRGEFNAIVVTNTYRSEHEPGMAIGGLARQLLLLVKDHSLGHIHVALPAPESFHKSAKIRHYLEMLWKEQPDMCRDIAAAPAVFNPLRDVRKAP